mmetsp:Transcript_12834/g.32340  ORF Transcript_12834/g.32340 Transcript_12834/m.32340 type:complete len:93 (+) Transcript_12834:1122-1400(+)
MIEPMTKFDVRLLNHSLHSALFKTQHHESVREQSVLLDASNNFVEFVEGAAVLVAEKIKTGKLLVVWHKLEPVGYVAQRLATLEMDPASCRR